MSWASTQGQPTAPQRTAAPGRRVPVGQVVLTVLVLALASTVVAAVAYLIAGPTGSPSAFAVVSTVLGLVVLVYLVRWRVVAGLRRGVTPLPWITGAAVVAYLVTPASWGGTALFWWVLVGPGPLAFVLDLPVWAAAAAVGTIWGTSQQQLVRQATPYG